VQNDRRAEGEQFAIALQSLAQRAQAAVLAVPDGDHIVGPEEHHDLAGIDDLRRPVRLSVVVMHGLHNGEQHVVVLLQLWPLVRLHCILDSQSMQTEMAGDSGELTLAGLVESDPHEARAATKHVVVGLLPGRLARLAASVSVDRAVDDRDTTVDLRNPR
jgi:hypothetical protein